MNGRERIEAAFSAEGTRDIPAVICYEGIYIRDHWPQLTTAPWWHLYELDGSRLLAWHRDVARKTGQDWFVLPLTGTREEQRSISLERRPPGVYRVDRRTGEEGRLDEPQIGGWSRNLDVQSVRPATLVDTREAIDRAIPLPDRFDPDDVVADGRADLARAILDDFGRQLCPIEHVASPLWLCYGLWGFEGLMELVATRPDLVRHAMDRYLTRQLRAVQTYARLGARTLWIEECLTDMIGPESFAALNVPAIRRLVAEIRAQKMKSIYYYCGDPAGKWDLLFDIGADALSLEESKKGFTIDIEDVVDRARGRCVVLGNLDAIGVLQDGTEDQLRAEIKHQLAAGRRNGSRFIMSLGSPVTPGTPVERVRRYCDLVHELGKS